MDDEEEPLTGPVDSMGQWTIKVIATQTKNAALAAAKAEGLNVGQWLERRIREWTAPAGQAVAVVRQPVAPAPAPPAVLALPAPAPADDLADLDRIVTLAGKVADLKEKAGGTKIVTEATRVLRDRLAGIAGPPTPSGKAVKAKVAKESDHDLNPARTAVDGLPEAGESGRGTGGEV